MGFFDRLKESLTRTRQGLVSKIEQVVAGRRAIDEGLYEELEEALIEADVGVDTALELMEGLRRRVKERKVKEPEQLKPLLQELIQEILEDGETALNRGGPPTVVLVVGVNGVGKTTTIGKLAHFYKSRGERVILAAADTFRAAAIDQLEIWGQRVGADVIKHREGADPAAVAYDALQAARARRAGVVICDTAGRLHTKSNLMEELKKIGRVLGKELPGAPHEVLLVLDATTGQNAVSQARLFGEATGVTGIVLTKLDGTAKGGVIIGIRRTLDIPVKFIGIGERVEDLRPFNPQEFVAALFEK
ncbi:signal recognition particle-docking protein FtsY [Desulfofundulus thermobenzoicus]|uniref:Signal recognition particle receptor FtsY n=1 Tax=Desulfofundulus thermobenzoicus TaxID=29376 RepID=A0A6N7INY9_9FIRM|nr:signal recognition particle-docking protein FtsY [Desulfofundulus thermobenzoicus]MQL51732.1 signal recognition particle-docking protein FtsY [Desulfofundulus thermobenzoicus]